MSDEPALLAAILAHPDEDTPRLMYADWLDEHGQAERAEFIRLQCAPELDNLSKGRMFELEEWYRSKWLAGLPQGSSLEWEFRRGFPEWLNGSGWLFLQQYDAVAVVVWLRTLTLTGVNESDVQDFVTRPWNPRWIGLELQSQAFQGFTHSVQSTPCIVAIANCPQAAQLRLLRFSLFEMAATGIHALASSPYLTNIQKLQIDCVTDLVALTLLRARFGDRLVIG